MPSAYTHKNLREVEDSAPKFGYEELQEARFASKDLEAEDTGVTHNRLAASVRTHAVLRGHPLVNPH